MFSILIEMSAKRLVTIPILTMYTVTIKRSDED